jgi:hypothetical protein
MPWISQDLRLFILLWFSRAFQEHLMTLKISEVYTLMSIPWSQASQEYAMALKNIRWILRILMIRLSGALEDSWCLSRIYRTLRTVGSVYTLMNNQGSLGMIRILGSMPGMPGLFKILGNMAWVWVWVWYEYEYDCLWLSRHVGIFILLLASDDLMASRNAIPYASQEYAMIAQEYLVTPMIWWLLWLPMDFYDSYDSYDWIVKSISRHPRLSWCFDAMMLWCCDAMMLWCHDLQEYGRTLMDHIPMDHILIYDCQEDLKTSWYQDSRTIQVLGNMDGFEEYRLRVKTANDKGFEEW